MKALLLLLWACPALATTWQLNKDHSEIFFQVDYLEVSEVTGRFGQFSGTAELNPTGSLGEVRLQIDPRSIDTGQRQRDGHLRAQDFLYTDKHRHIIFHATEMKRLSPTTYRAVGTLTVRGVSRPHSVDLTLTPGLKDTWGYENKFVKFSSQLSRQDYGIKWNKTLLDGQHLVGDVVRFWGSLQLQPVKGVTPTSKHMIPDTPAIRAREKLKRGEITEAQYRESIKTSEVSIEVTPIPPAAQTPAPVPVPAVAGQQDPRTRMSWQLWFWLLGLLGFGAAIFTGIQMKQWCIRWLGERYEENGPWGHLSDFLTIGITLLFATAFWYVGWG